MPLFDFRCDRCGLEFEVSRPLSRAEEPANCPIDNASCHRIAAASGGFIHQGERRANALPRPPQLPGFSHFGHSHDSGSSIHSH